VKAQHPSIQDRAANRRKRAQECVNACEGISDPAEALRLAREAFPELVSLAIINTEDPHKWDAAISKARAAIDALTPKPAQQKP
jgi:hypothetical protein